MKTNKSPESETTPSKKKLKQARLPFKLISEGSPTPITPQTRKRKLSTTEADSASKVGKISKENDLVEELVVISDEESKDGDKSQNTEKSHNPFVKLVDTAWKKKLQAKAKGSKKRKNSKKTKSNGPSKHASNTNESGDCEMMQVDPTEVISETELNMMEPVCDIVVLEDSNNSSDVMDKKESHIAVNKSNDVDSPKKESKRDVETNLKLDKSLDEKSPEKCNSTDKEKLATKDTEPSEKLEITLKEPGNGSKSTELKKDVSRNVKEPAKTENNTESEIPDNEKETEENIVVTPKRSARNIAKEKNNNSKGSPSSSKLSDSVCSTPTTPKQTKSSSISNNQDESLNESINSAKLTPKQVQKKLESAKKKEEKEKERIEREVKRQQEKEERAKQRQEKEDQKKKEREEKEEAKKRERDEKEEQKKKEKEEKDRQKELEKKQREEKEELKKKEKEEKEEQKKKEKEAREEEKRKKQEALELEKQEQELKKKKAAEAFVNFFVPKQKSEKDQATIGPVSKNCSGTSLK